MKTCICIAMAFLFSGLETQAQTPVGFDFLRTQANARPAAMGGAYVAMLGELSSLAYNPAALAFITGKQASASYINHLLDFNTGAFAFAQNIQGGTGAVFLNFIDYGQFERSDKFGGVGSGEEFGVSGLNAGLTYTRFIKKNISAGGSIKFIRLQIDNLTSSAWATDLGFTWCFPKYGMTIGAAVLNWGTVSTALIQSKDALPTSAQIGLAKKLQHLPATISIAGIKYTQEPIDFRLGAEIELAKQFRGRIGYDSVGLDQQLGTDWDRVAGFSIGLGFIVDRFQIDYSFSSFGEIGALNKFSLNSQL